MGRYIIRRLLWAVVVLIIVSAVTFVIFYALPSADPAVLRAGRSPNPALIAHIRHTLGLDRPIYVQYWTYIKGIVLHFNFGYSYQYSLPVRSLIFQKLPATISLTVGAVIVWLLLGIPVGIISATRPRTWMDRMTMGVSLLAIRRRSTGSGWCPSFCSPTTSASCTSSMGPTRTRDSPRTRGGGSVR